MEEKQHAGAITHSMAVFRGRTGQDRMSTRNARSRRPLSCLPCQTRKLRCDRALPACGSCVNRGDITTCGYLSRKPGGRPKPQGLSDVSDSAQARIDHLEELVLTLLKNSRSAPNQVHTPSTSVHADPPGNIEEADADHHEHDENGNPNEQTTTVLAKSSIVSNISFDLKERLSVNEAHWVLLLNEIGEVRSHLHAQRNHYEEQTKRISQLLRRSSDEPGPTLLFGSTRTMSRSEILLQLPSRYSCNIMVTRFFAHLYPALHILHQSTFHKQYERFWNDESTTSTAWIALLFAVLRIAMLDYLREDDEPQEYQGKCQDLANTFRNRLTDCLILADYTRPQDFLIEALSFHLYGEYVSSRDAKSSTWVLSGMIVRLAMRMGYHQESQPALTSTPFQIELRRRTWAHIRSADVMLSFQMGLPSMVGLRSLEGPFPRNIHDDQNFNEDCTTIPPALPDTDLTQVSYLIAKTKVVFGFARVLDEINRLNAMRWERVLEIDRELHHIYDNIPEHFKLGQLSSQQSLVLVSARFTLSSIHHKSLCVLHSRFFESKKADDRFSYSRRVCLSSAMSILRFQAIQNQKIPVDGYLRSVTNYQTSLAIHDYLLAATIITADLCSGHVADNIAGQQVMQGVPTRTEMIKALKLSSQILGQMRDESLDAYKAVDILEILVRKFEAEDQKGVQSQMDAQHVPNNCSNAIALGLESCSSHQQTTPREFSAASAAFSSPSCKNALNPSTIQVRRPQYLSYGPSHVSQTSLSSYTNVSNTESSGFPEFSSLDPLSCWSDYHVGDFCAHSPSLPQVYPNCKSSAGCMPDIPSQSMLDGNSGTSIPSTSPMADYAPLALHDPMSTLWSFAL